MARYLGPTCKLSRREGVDLQLKSGVRAIEEKCKINTRPGQFGARKGRFSNYGVQLREKQKVKRMYGILEKQFHKYYIEAARRKGNTGVNLLCLLESRLDNVVYRVGFGVTRSEARQIVSHKSILVNDTICNIPSYILSPGDTIKIRDKSKSQLRIKNALEIQKTRELNKWIDFDSAKLEAVFKQVPDRSSLSANINEQLIVELYSK